MSKIVDQIMQTVEVEGWSSTFYRIAEAQKASQALLTVSVERGDVSYFHKNKLAEIAHSLVDVLHDFGETFNTDNVTDPELIERADMIRLASADSRARRHSDIDKVFNA